jgi:tripartite-type tricarboxylate transporter receptor subunit TctC
MVAVAAVASLSTLVSPARGETAVPYPNRPVRLIVSYQSGTAIDTVARIVAEKLQANLGQPVVIENRPGMSGNIAEDFVAKSAPDGHTLLVAGFSLVTVPGIYGAKGVDPIQAFTPVGLLATQPLALMVHPSLGFDSLPDLIAEARRHPGKLTYSTTGAASPASLVARMLWARAGVELLHIPYGTSGAFKDLLSGEVPITFNYLQGKETYLENHQLRALAVTGGSRVAAFPNTPTVAEQGFPGFEFTSWFGLLAPAGTPAAIVRRLNGEVARILQLPDTRERFAGLGIEPAGGTPEQFATQIREELARWTPIVKAADIKEE